MKYMGLIGVTAVACTILAACASDSTRRTVYDPRGPQTIVLSLDVYDSNHERGLIEIVGAVTGTQAIAIRPMNADASCSRVTASFANGRSRDLDIGPREYLGAGRLYWMDLPGDERALTEIELICRPVGANAVTLEVLASR